jgi:hypothetical protein
MDFGLCYGVCEENESKNSGKGFHNAIINILRIIIFLSARKDPSRNSPEGRGVVG